MKVIYKDERWYVALAVDNYRTETPISREYAMQCIERGWPFDLR